MAGAKGDKGDTGSTGPIGPKGDTGDAGLAGAKGDKGDKGDAGDIGPAGAKGDIGDTGAQGIAGEQGPKGDKGDPGDGGDSSPAIIQISQSTPTNITEELVIIPLNLSDIDFNEGGFIYTPTSGELIVPESGYYAIDMHLTFQTSIAQFTNTIVIIRVVVNDVQKVQQEKQNSHDLQSYLNSFSFHTTLNLSAGDVVRFELLTSFIPPNFSIQRSEISAYKMAGTIAGSGGSDNQTLAVSGNNLSILRGNTIAIDGDPTNEIQTLSLSGNELSLSNGGGTVTLPTGGDPGTSYTAGAGINIAGTSISNTGDLNAADDITNASTAGGDLTGTFNNLQINANTVGSAELVNGAVIGSKIAQAGATPGQALTWNGSSWAPSTIAGGGGGGISGSGSAGNIARWINNTTLGNSSFLQDLEGNIGLGTIPQTAYKMIIKSTDGPNFKTLELKGNNSPGASLNFSLNDAAQSAEINVQSAATNFRTTSDKLAFNARSITMPASADHLAIKSNGQITMGLFNPVSSAEILSIKGDVGLQNSSFNFYNNANVAVADISALDAANKLHIHSLKTDAGIEMISTGGKIELSTNGVGGSTSEIVIENGKVTIGNGFPTSPKLEVLGQVKINGGAPGLGKVLTSDATGLATWQTPSAGGAGLFANNIWATTIGHNVPSIKQILVSPEPGSVLILDNTVLNVAAQNQTSIANFMTLNTENNSKMVKIHNHGTATEFTNPIALDIRNKPYLDSGIGIKIEAGSTGIDVRGDLTGIKASSLDLGVAASFDGGTGVIASGRGKGVLGSANFNSNLSAGVSGIFAGTGNFDGAGLEGTSLPSNTQVHEYQAYGIGGKFVGGNKGISASTGVNPSSIYNLDLRTYTERYGSQDRPMAGFFQSANSVGLMAVSETTHKHTTEGPIGIGIVGRSRSAGSLTKSIGVFGQGEGEGERIGVMGYAGANASISIGVRGEAAGDFGIGGVFVAPHALRLEGENLGVQSLAPRNQFLGGGADPLISATNLLTGPAINANSLNGKGAILSSSATYPLELKQNSTGNYGLHIIANDNITNAEIWVENDLSLNFAVDNGSESIMGWLTAEGFTNTSDKKFKKEIQPLSATLGNIMMLEPVKYEMTTDKSGKNHIGFLAQDIQKIYPEMVSETSVHGEKRLGVNYSLLGVVSVKAIQEQQVIIESQQQQIDQLKNELAELKSMLLELKNDK